jgi:hypothetical protein
MLFRCLFPGRYPVTGLHFIVLCLVWKPGFRNDILEDHPLKTTAVRNSNLVSLQKFSQKPAIGPYPER